MASDEIYMNVLYAFAMFIYTNAYLYISDYKLERCPLSIWIVFTFSIK